MDLVINAGKAIYNAGKGFCSLAAEFWNLFLDLRPHSHRKTVEYLAELDCQIVALEREKIDKTGIERIRLNNRILRLRKMREHMS
jgi:hypothetical protein